MIAAGDVSSGTPCLLRGGKKRAAMMALCTPERNARRTRWRAESGGAGVGVVAGGATKEEVEEGARAERSRSGCEEAMAVASEVSPC